MNDPLSTYSRNSHFNEEFQFSQVLVLGDSWVRHFYNQKNIAVQNGIQFDAQWWPSANIETIMQNLKDYVKPYHKNLLIFCLISETWRYEALEKISGDISSSLYQILMPNPDFTILNFVKKFTELRNFCNHLNPNLKVILVTPPRIDVYQFNLELISKFPLSFQEIFHSNSKYEASQMAEYSKEIYGKIIEMCNYNHGWPEKSIFRNQIIAQKVKSCQKLFTKFMKSKINTCGKQGPFVDGINPTVDFIRVFWDQVKSWLDVKQCYDSLPPTKYNYYKTDEESNICASQNSVPDGSLDSSKLNVLMIGDYTVNGLDFGVQAGMPHITVNYIPYGKLEQLIELAESYLDEKYDALVLVPFNWEFLNLTCLMSNGMDPKVPQINVNISFDKILQSVMDATQKWMEQFVHLKVIWGLPYPIDFCRYYARIVTEYGSSWNPTPEINSAILYITKKFYSFILQLEEYVHKAKPPLNYIDLRNCFFLKEFVLECSFHQSNTPKFPPFCLSENGIDPSDTLCQRFKYALIDKLNELDVKPSLAYRRRRIRMQKQKKRMLKRHGDDVSETDDSLNNDFNSNVGDPLQPNEEYASPHPRQEGFSSSVQSYTAQNSNYSDLNSYPDVQPPDISEQVPLHQVNVQQPSNIRMMHQSRNIPMEKTFEHAQQSGLQQPSNLNQLHTPLQDMHIHPSHRPQDADINQSFEQLPMSTHRLDFPSHQLNMQKSDISPHSMVKMLRADIPPPPPLPPPLNIQEADMPPLPRDMNRPNMPSHPSDNQWSEMHPQSMCMERSHMPTQPMSHYHPDLSQSMNSRQSDLYQSGGMYKPVYSQQQLGMSQQHQIQQFSVLHSTNMPQQKITSPQFMQQVHTQTRNESFPNYLQQQGSPLTGHIQQYDMSQDMYMQTPEEPQPLHPIQNRGIVSDMDNKNFMPSVTSSVVQQEPASTSKDLLITGSMLDTLKEALNYLKSSKSNETVVNKNTHINQEEPILVQQEKEEHSDNSPFKILDINESSYSCKLSLFFQQNRWKDLFLKGNKTVAMDTLFSAIKAMIILKPGGGVKIIMITTSESFIYEVEKSLSSIVETSLIGVNNDIPFGAPIALIDSPTNLRLRLAQSRFCDASELGALIVFGDDLIYNVHSPASIELSHLLKLIYNKAPSEFVNKVVISEAGIEEYEEVACQILATRFSTKKEKKRSHPKDDGLSLFEMLAEELEKEEAEELMMKEAAKQKELEQKSADEVKQKQVMHKLRGVSPISADNSILASPVSDSSLPDMEDEDCFAKFLESLGPTIEKEYMEIGKQILISHEKQYQNFIDVPVYHPDFKVKRDTFTIAYKKKFGINYKQEPFEDSWKTFWKNYVTELKEDEWNKKMTKLQEKFRIKHGKGSLPDDLKGIHGCSPFTNIATSQSDRDSPSNERAIADMMYTELGKKNIHESLNIETTSPTKRTVEDMVNVMLGKKNTVEHNDYFQEMDIVKNNILLSMASDNKDSEIVKKLSAEKNHDDMVSKDPVILNSEDSENILRSEKEEDISVDKENIIYKKEIVVKLHESIGGKLKDSKILNDNEKKAHNEKVKEIDNKKKNDNENKKFVEIMELAKNNEQKTKNIKETGTKNLKAKMQEFEKKKYAKIANEEDFVSLIFDAKETTEKVSETLVEKKNTSSVLDMFQEDDKVIPESKNSSASMKLGSIQQQLNQLKAEKKIPSIVPMKFIRGNLPKNSGKVGDPNSTLNPATPTTPSLTINYVAAKEDKGPLFKPATFVEVSPVKGKPLKGQEKVSCIFKTSELKAVSANILSSTHSKNPGGVVSDLWKPSVNKPLSLVGTDDCIDELMKTIGSGKHFKGAKDFKSISAKRMLPSRERSRSPIREDFKIASESQNLLGLYLKEKEKLSKGKDKQGNDSKVSSSSQDNLSLYLKECKKLSTDKSKASENKILSSKETLDLYLGAKQSSDKGKKDESDNLESKNTLELYLRAKKKDSIEKNSNIPSSSKATLDLYLKEKQSVDKLNNYETKNSKSVSHATVDLDLKEKREGSNFGLNSIAALDLYLKEKQRIEKGNEDKGNNIGSGSKATLNLYLKEKHSFEKGGNSKSSKDALELYLKEKQATEKGNLTKSSILGSGSKAILDLYLKEKQSNDKGNKEKSCKSSSANEALDLYLKEKQALNKSKQAVSIIHGIGSDNSLDLYLREKEKQPFAKGKQDMTSSSKEQLELYLKEKMASQKDKRSEQDLHCRNSPIKKLKLDFRSKEGNGNNAEVKSDPLKNKQDLVIMDNALNLLESICDVIGMMGHALKAIISQAKELLPDYKKALNVFAEDDSIALVNYAIKKMNTLSNGSETHKYSKIIKLATKLLEEAKPAPLTIRKVYSEPSEISRNFPVDVASIAKATIGKDSAQTYQFIKTTYLYKGLNEPSINELEEVFKAVSQLHFTLTFKS